MAEIQYLPLSYTQTADICPVIFIKLAAVFTHVKLAACTDASSLEEHRESLQTSNTRILIEVLALCQHPRLGHLFSQVRFFRSVIHGTTSKQVS